MREIEISAKSDKADTIDNLIQFLQEAKQKGATHYRMEWSHDLMWDFKWLRTYRTKSDEELKNEEIEGLEKRLSELKK